MEGKRANEGERGIRNMYVWKREKGSERTLRAPVDVPHFYHQCLTSVAPAWPPRNESITLNNVNVSPSQHKTNNHCSLPRATSAWPPQPPEPQAPFSLLFSVFVARSVLVDVASLKSRHLPMNVCLQLYFVNGSSCLFYTRAYNLHLHPYLIRSLLVLLSQVF